jgi:hypothetical protein
MPPAASRVLDVRPGDEEAAEQVEEWLLEFQLTTTLSCANGSSWPTVEDRLALPGLHRALRRMREQLPP